ERLGHRDLEARRLRGDRVLERPALHAGHDGLVDLLRVLLLAEDEARAWAGERLVRRRGDEVAVRDGIRQQTGRHEPGEVRHVAEQQRATSSAISRKRSASTTRGYAEPPQTMIFGRCSFASRRTSS